MGRQEEWKYFLFLVLMTSRFVVDLRGARGARGRGRGFGTFCQLRCCYLGNVSCADMLYSRMNPWRGRERIKEKNSYRPIIIPRSKTAVMKIIDLRISCNEI